MNANIVKRIEWNDDKNAQLKAERNLSFEQIQLAIAQGRLIDIIPHPKIKFSHQQILLVDIEGYVVLVPFVEDDEKIFLKTAYKSRKLTKDYLRGKHHDKAAKG